VVTCRAAKCTGGACSQAAAHLLQESQSCCTLTAGVRSQPAPHCAHHRQRFAPSAGRAPVLGAGDDECGQALHFLEAGGDLRGARAPRAAHLPHQASSAAGRFPGPVARHSAAALAPGGAGCVPRASRGWRTCTRAFKQNIRCCACPSCLSVKHRAWPHMHAQEASAHLTCEDRVTSHMHEQGSRAHLCSTLGSREAHA